MTPEAVAYREAQLAGLRKELREVEVILAKYIKGDIGAAGADEQIMKIFFRLGHARSMQIPPLQVGFHKLNRGGILGNSMGPKASWRISSTCLSPGRSVLMHFA